MNCLMDVEWMNSHIDQLTMYYYWQKSSWILEGLDDRCGIIIRWMNTCYEIMDGWMMDGWRDGLINTMAT